MKITETLGASQAIQRAFTGRHILMRAADSPVEIFVRGQESVTLERGEMHDLGRVVQNGYARIKNIGTGSNSIDIEVTERPIGKPSDNQVNANVTTSLEFANRNTPLNQVSIAAGATVVIAVANASRKELRVGVSSDQPNGVWLGDGTTTEGRGGYLEEGMVDYLSTEGVVYAHNPGDASVVVNILELERV